MGGMKFGKPVAIARAERWLKDLELADSYGGPAPEGQMARQTKREVAEVIQGLLELKRPRPLPSQTQQDLKDRIVCVLQERGESLLDDRGVDHEVCKEIAAEIVEGASPREHKRDECYSVHVYASVRVKVCGVSADLLPEAAIKYVEDRIDLSRLFDRESNQVPAGTLTDHQLWIDHVEYAEGIEGFLVDHPNDPEYQKSTFYDQDGKTPVQGDPARVVIVVEGGNVQSILKDRAQVSVAVLDHDNQKEAGKLPPNWTIEDAFREADQVELDPMLRQSEEGWKKSYS